MFVIVIDIFDWGSLRVLWDTFAHSLRRSWRSYRFARMRRRGRAAAAAAAQAGGLWEEGSGREMRVADALVVVVVTVVTPLTNLGAASHRHAPQDALCMPVNFCSPLNSSNRIPFAARSDRCRCWSGNLVSRLLLGDGGQVR